MNCLYFEEMLVLQLRNNLTKTEIQPSIFLKKWPTYKSYFDLLVSYHDFLLMFLSPIVIIIDAGNTASTDCNF